MIMSNEKNPGKEKIFLCQTDITKLEIDAIVNAANSSLLGGGGVDGAIHRAAGIELLKECQTLGGCKTGQSKITGGYKLPSKYIIHTVGPIWKGGNNKEKDLLKSCYHNSLTLATENNLSSIAFPNISTGIYGFPKEEACEIAVVSVEEYLSFDNTIERVIFTCFDNENLEIYKRRLDIKY